MGSFPELVNISGFLVFLVVCSLSSKIKVLIISVPFALLVLLASALMADFLKDVYDEVRRTMAQEFLFEKIL